MTNRVLALLAILFVLPGTGRAAWPVDGTAVSTAGSTQGYPVIVSDGAGGAIIAWVDSRNGTEDIYAQRVNAAGTALWTPDGVPVCTAVQNQTAVAIASDESGGAIMVWEDYRLDGISTDLFAQRINSAGVVQWLANGRVLCTSSNSQRTPAMIPDGLGGAIVTWYDDRLGAWDIFVGRLNSAGVTVWPVAGVPVCNASQDQINPTLAPDGSGGIIVSWQDARQPMNTDIFARRVDSTGGVLWTANGNAICAAINHQYSPLIVSDGAGGAIIAWTDGRVSNAQADIYVQRVNSAGSAQWAANGVSVCAATNDQYVKMVATDGAGGLIAAWQDRRSGAFDVYARRIDVTGAALWTPDGVAICTASEEQGLPSVIADGSGGAVVAWHDNRGPNAFNIYAQRVDAAGATQWTADGVALCTAEFNQLTPVLATDGAGGAIVAWQDSRSNVDDDIYAHRVSGSGLIATGVTPARTPSGLVVGAAYPNPFTGETFIDVTLAIGSRVSVDVFDVSGRRVRSIDVPRVARGATRLSFDGLDDRTRRLPSGVYFYRVRAGNETVTRKLVIAR